MSLAISERGFSLIEMLVVVVIMAVIATGVSLSLGVTDRAQLRSSCFTLVAAVRYAYSHAVTHGMTTRIVLDFDERSIGIQETSGRVVLNREDETGEGLGGLAPDAGVESKTLLDRQMDAIGSSFGGATSPTEPSAGTASSPLGMAMNMGLGTGEDGMSNMMDTMQVTDPFLSWMLNGGLTGNPAGYRRPRFKKIEGRRGESRILKGDTSFVVAFTPHEPQPREDGKAYVYFFPAGITEHAIIQLSDGDDRIYSVEIHPLNGRAFIHNEAIEPEEDLDDLQEAEE